MRCILSIICVVFQGGVTSLTILLWIFVDRKVGAQDEVVEAVQVRRHRVVTLRVEPDLRAHGHNSLSIHCKSLKRMCQTLFKIWPAKQHRITARAGPPLLNSTCTADTPNWHIPLTECDFWGRLEYPAASREGAACQRRSRRTCKKACSG